MHDTSSEYRTKSFLMQIESIYMKLFICFLCTLKNSLHHRIEGEQWWWKNSYKVWKVWLQLFRVNMGARKIVMSIKFCFDCDQFATSHNKRVEISSVQTLSLSSYRANEVDASLGCETNGKLNEPTPGKSSFNCIPFKLFTFFLLQLFMCR